MALGGAVFATDVAVNPASTAPEAGSEAVCICGAAAGADGSAVGLLGTDDGPPEAGTVSAAASLVGPGLA